MIKSRIFLLTILTIFVLLFLNDNRVYSQSKMLLPYLSGDLYGLSDLKGNTIVEPNYDEIIFVMEDKLLACRKGELWGIMNFEGNLLVPVVLHKAKYGKTPTINKVFSKYNYSKDESKPIPQLFHIHDTESDISYYINPLNLLKEYTPFADVQKVRKGRKYFYNAATKTEGITKVATQDHKINFIDTTGQLIFSNSFYDGFLISEKFFAIDNGKEKYALYNYKKEQLTEYNYSRISVTQNPDFAFCIPLDKKLSKTLIDVNGNVFFKEQEGFQIIDNFVIINEKEFSGIYSFTGLLLHSFEKSSISSLYNSPKHLRLQTENYKYGVLDLKGNIVVKPVYSSINGAKNNNFIFTKDGSCGVISADYKTLFTLDKELTISEFKDYSVLNKTKYYVSKYGLIDSLGKIVIEPKYDKLHYLSECKLAKVLKDFKWGILNLDNEWVIKPQENDISVRSDNCTFTIKTEDDIIVYDKAGNRNTDKKFNQNSYYKSKLTAKRISQTKYGTKKNDVFVLVDKNDKEYTNPIYIKIHTLKDKENEKSIHLCLRNKDDLWLNILDDNATNISPKGYGYFKYENLGNKNSLILHNIEDIDEKKSKFRSGVIDFEGNWLIKPDYFPIKSIDNKLLVSIKDFNKTTIYDRNGIELNKYNYNFVGMGGMLSGDKILNDRVRAGTFLNKEKVLKYLEELSDLRLDRNNYKELSKLKEPDVLVGYINSKGEEIIKPKYSSANTFQYKYTTVSEKDKNGKEFASIIDVNGNAILKTDYEKLKVLSTDSTLFKATLDNKLGMIDIKGKLISDPKYYSIIKSRIEDIFIAHDSINHYLFDRDFNSIKVDSLHWKNSFFQRISTIELSEEYFMTKMAKPNNYLNNDYHFFSMDLKFIFSLNDFHVVSNKLNNYQLPNGFVSVQKTKESKPYIINFTTGFEYRSK